ncbi:unnamed protein product, partial [Cladocopium goreaui]
MEPSYALVDKCASMRETGSLLWIHPSQCTKREQEVQQTLKEKSQVLKIENMTLKMAADTETFEADHGTELKLMWCFQRRGLAFDQAALISWDKHESWVSAMFQAYSAEPPPSFAKVTMPQLLRADKELFTILAREVESIQPDGVGNRPLDDQITKLKTDPRVTMHLLPLPTKAHSVEASNASKPDAGKPKAKIRPGKRARATTEVKMPDELKGGHSKTSDNKPICWAFNMKDGCSAKTYGNPDEGSHETAEHSAEAWTVNRKLMHGGDFRVCDSVLKDECSSQKRNCICINGFAGDFEALEKVGEIRSIGIPREPEDFVVRAVAADHQRNLFAEDWPARDPYVMENAFIRNWLKRASELASKEKDLHHSLDPEVARAQKGKRFLVIEEILNDIGFPDRHLAKDIWAVFLIVGWLRDSIFFPHRSKPPQYSVDALLRFLKGLCRSIFESVNPEEASDAPVGAWEGTIKEMVEGWLVEDKNPDLDQLMVARRFGLMQKSKVRVDDDFKQCGVNGSTGLPGKYVLPSIEAIAATLVRALSVGLPQGGTLGGTILYLVAAYKQCAIHPKDRERVHICVKDVEQGVAKVYKIGALPFGAVRSVAGFLRTSATLACVRQVCLGFWWSNFFDYFPTLSTFSMVTQCKAQVSVISKRATPCSLDGSLATQLYLALQFPKELVSVSKPVELTKSAGKAYYIFTDGAVESTAEGSQIVASVGGILYNSDGEAEAFFSKRVPQLILDLFLQHSSHPIFEVELLAVL